MSSRNWSYALPTQQRASGGVVVQPLLLPQMVHVVPSQIHMSFRFCGSPAPNMTISPSTPSYSIRWPNRALGLVGGLKRDQLVPVHSHVSFVTVSVGSTLPPNIT